MKYYAQSGEDRFLETLLPRDGFFVDIGAYDGVRFSNTKMVYDWGWSGLAIEGNLKYFESLMENMPSPSVVKIPRYIKEGELDQLLEIYNINKDYELLNVDIDSYDYELWKQSTVYQPKFVIIEVSSPEVSKAMQELAVLKGYELIWDEANLIFKKK